MHKSKYENNRFHSIDKEMNHHSVYIKDIYVLDMNCYFNQTKAVLIGWTLTGKKSYMGYTVEDLLKTLDNLKNEYKLTEYSDKCFYKDQVMIYTSNIAKVYGFLQDYVKDKDVFGTDLEIKQFTIKDYFIVSIVGGWTNQETNIGIYNDMKYIMDNIFVPNKNVYLTPYQYNRKLLKHFNKIPSVVPNDVVESIVWRGCYYGGAAFSKRNIPYLKKNIVEFDRKSAYLYEYFMPHMSGPMIPIDTNLWKNWTDNFEDTISFGLYKIKFTMNHRMLNIFNRNKEPWRLNTEYEITISLLSIDLKLFLQCANIIDITCLSLYKYEKDMLPKPIIDHIVKCFIDKETYKDDIHKTIANANYGSLCMELTHEQVKELNKKPYYSPMWGYEIAAYARQHLYDCGKNLDSWLYSDTDSIFCLDTPENRVQIDLYNEYMQKVIKKGCEFYNLDFKQLERLGLFKEEVKITDFIVKGIRTYAYMTVDGEFIQKASGMCEDAKNTFEDWISEDKDLDYGHRVVRTVKKDGYYEKTEKFYAEPNLNMSDDSMLTILLMGGEKW